MISEDGRCATFLKKKPPLLNQRNFAYAFAHFTIGDGASTTCKIRISRGTTLFVGLVATPITFSYLDLTFRRAEWTQLWWSDRNCPFVLEMHLDIDRHTITFLPRTEVSQHSSVIKKPEMVQSTLVPFIAVGLGYPEHFPVSVEFIN